MRAGDPRVGSMDAPSVLAELRRESHSIFNRIHSVAEDTAFVERVHEHYPTLPLLPNMRCGAWYTDPKIASAERAYFKSTDGHTNNWSFNLRRPNLHILPLIVKHTGLVLVDSTRAGKRIPDALSKTVPIWCAVVNRAIRLRAAEPSPPAWDIAFYTPPGSVSPQEHSQIELKLDGWASQLAASSYQLPSLDRPLRPMWITPATTVFPSFLALPDRAFYPIICVSASKQVLDGVERRASGFAYIQGSGDDHELWGMGLTPLLYWRHHDEILSAGPLNLPDLVRLLVADASHIDSGDGMRHLDHPLSCGTPVERVFGRIALCSTASLHRQPEVQPEAPPQGDVAWLVLCSTSAPPVEPSFESLVAGSTAPTTRTGAQEQAQAPRTLRIQTPGGKKGQHHFLAAILPRALPFVQHHLQHERRTVCIACPTGTDASVGVALAALALFFRPDGSCCARENVRDDLSKDVLKTRLQWIIASCPQANPSRTTLKRVNDFLLSPSSDPSSMLDGPSRSPENRTPTLG